MTVDWSVARSLAGLKFRLIRHSPQALIGMILGSALGGLLGFGAISGVLALRGYEGRGAALAVAGAAGLIIWLIGPIVLGGGELILDLKVLALYPFDLRTLLGGLLLAAFVGVPFAVTCAVALSTVTHGQDPVAAAVLAWAALQFAVTAVVAGRVSVGLVGLLTTSRFRSIAGAITVLFAISFGVIAQAAPFAARLFTIERLESARSVVRWLPIGWTPEAAAQASLGHHVTAVGFALLGLTVPAGLLAVWRWIVIRLLAGRGAQTKPRPAKPLVGPMADRFLSPTTAAAWAKSVRAIRRDPREWTEIAAFLPLVLAFTLPNLIELQNGDPRLVLASFVAAASGATMVSTNLFGADGPRFTADAIPGTDMWSVLVGKLLARLPLVGAVVIVGTTALAWLLDGWRYLPVSLVLQVQSLLIGAIAGLFVTIRAPVPLPDKVGGLNTNSAGCITPLFQVGALIVADVMSMVAAAPAVVLALFLSPWLATLAAVITLPLCWLGLRARLRYEADRTQLRIPELVTALTARQ